jgi:iron complex transport system substrate-binding protein
LGLLDRDLLVWNAGFSPELRGVLAGNPLYQQLGVVRDKRVLFLEDATASGALTWSTVLSLPYAIDTVTPQLATALGGNGNG